MEFKMHLPHQKMEQDPTEENNYQRCITERKTINESPKVRSLELMKRLSAHVEGNNNSARVLHRRKTLTREKSIDEEFCKDNEDGYDTRYSPFWFSLLFDEQIMDLKWVYNHDELFEALNTSPIFGL